MYTKVVISRGKEVGGLESFAKSLKSGFENKGIEAEVMPLYQILKNYKILRDKKILKIYSTSSVFLSPFSNESICIAHGFPGINGLGIIKSLLVLLSYVLANRFSKLVSVSYFVQKYLYACYDIKIDYVIYNPISDIFLQKSFSERIYITFVGRFHRVKKVDIFIQPLKKVLKNHPNLKVMLVGHGEEKSKIINLIGEDTRFKLLDSLDSNEIKDLLSKSKVVFSGCEIEALGISYIEALSQGCNVVMPSCGGGLEIAHDLIGSRIFTYSLKEDDAEIINAFDYAIQSSNESEFNTEIYSATNIATEYLNIMSMGSEND